MAQFSDRWNQFWFRSSSGWPEALFRIAYPTILLFDCLGLRGRLNFLFSNQGLHSSTAIDFLYPPAAVNFLYWVWIIVLVLLIFGFLTRATSLLNFLFVVYFFGFRDGVVFHAADWILHPLAFYLVWMASSRHLSIDKKWRLTKEPFKTYSLWPVRLAQIHFAAMYFTAGISKLFDSGWMDGSALQNTLAHPVLSYFDFSWLLPYGEFLKAANYGVIAWEIVFPFLFLFRKTRPWALLSAVIFHVGIGLTIRTAWFGEYCLSGMLLFIDDLPIRTVQKSNVNHPARGKLARVFTNFFICFHLVVFSWTQIGSISRGLGQRRLFFKIPLVSLYAKHLARIEFFNVWPSHFFLTPVHFLFFEAVHPDGNPVPLPPFDEEGGFAPGFRYVKEAREGMLMFRIASRGLSNEKWQIYVQDLIRVYRKEYGDPCPREIRISRIEEPLSAFETRPKELRVSKKPILTAKITCQEGAPEIDLNFS